MLNKFFRVTMLLSVLTLVSACGPIYKTTYTYDPPDAWSGRKCVNRCLAVQSRCKIACRRSNQACIANAQDEGAFRYRQYARKQRRAGKKIVLGPGDFTDTQACHESCGCGTNYRECYLNCGGKVITHRRCVAFCPKPKPHYTVRKVKTKKST